MYVIYWKYRPSDDWEEIDRADTHEECRFLLNEYRLAYGCGQFSVCHYDKTVKQ